jgi:hypothetical protein
MSAGSPNPVLTRAQSELVAFLFGTEAHDIRPALTTWIVTSPRYAAFVAQYKDKIRKKLRVTREAGAAADLLYELQIPYWLLAEARFEVAYEPYSAGKTRGPDYSVTFRTNFTFNLEVTHLHSLERTATEAGTVHFRLVDVLCSKLSQMLPNMANLLLVVAAPAVLEALDLPAHIAWIKDKAEHADPAFYARHRFSNSSDFFKHYQRLSGLVLVQTAGDRQAVAWFNPQARIKIPDGLKHRLQRCFSPLESGD